MKAKHINTPKLPGWFDRTLWLTGTFLLIYLGLGLIRVRRFRQGPIHIHLWEGHGFETQDLVAVIMISLGVVWFLWGSRRYRGAMEAYIRQQPIRAFLMALTAGLVVGAMLGIGIGAFFEEPIEVVVKSMLEPAEMVASQFGKLV